MGMQQMLLKGMGKVVVGQQVFTSDGTFTVPAGVTAVSVVVVGGGGGGGPTPGPGYGGGGGGGALAYKNNISVTPGASITVTVGEPNFNN